MSQFQWQRRPARGRPTGRPARSSGLAPPAPDQRAALQEALGRPVRPQLTLGTPDDAHEREAEAVARQVMAPGSGQPGPEATVRRQCAACAEEHHDETLRRRETPGTSTAATTTLAGAQAQAIHGLRGQGQPMPAGERRFFEPRLGADLSQVRLHTDTPAARLAGSLSARAFAVGQDLVFGAGQYRPGTPEGRHLLAHELTHVLQQGHGAGETLRRVIELRPPGRGEASAFARAGELVDRLNSLTRALHYTLDGRVLRCEVLDESHLNEFDRQMQTLIGLEAVLPMRLITSAGRTEDNPGSGFQPVVHDTWTRAYVDLDDLLASDALGFKTQMVHILTERAETRNYAARIGSSTFTLAEYERAHGRAYQAETRVLRDEIGDSTITYRYSEENPPGTWRVVFGSREGYRIVKVFRHFQRERVPAETYALDKKGRRMTIEELIAWRQQNTAGGAASAAPAHASAPVPPAAPAPSPAPAPGPAPKP
ncbi:eCIS core domain-containing protein [Ideonella dechloratans]|uniref:eCIS core domain-containing protein n=1 Tax=Ideonella dechloratans TaxID=36863 RepID=UPI0035B34571